MDTLKPAVDRLRGVKSRFEEDQHHDGHAAGHQWAIAEADPRQLKDLDECRLILDASPLTFDSWLGDADEASPHIRFMLVVEPELADDISLATERWHSFVGEDPATTDSAFVRGFAEAALEVWSQMQGRI